MNDRLTSVAGMRVLDADTEREESGRSALDAGTQIGEPMIGGRPFSDFAGGQSGSDIPEMVIEFTEDGEVNALKRDELNLGFLGKEEVGRASTIEWNDMTQSWGINLKGKYQFMTMPIAHDWEASHPHQVRCESLKYDECIGFDNYEEARDCEVRWIEHCEGDNIECMSDAGLAFLSTLRNRARIL